MPFDNTLIPTVNTGRVRAWGSLWRGSDDQQDPGVGVNSLISAVQLGFMPRASPDYQRSGDATYLHASTPLGPVLVLARESLLDSAVLDPAMPTALPHAESALYSFGFSTLPFDELARASAIFGGIDGGTFSIYVRPVNLLAASDYGVYWNNELGVTNDDLRMVFTPVGPFLVIRGPSTFRPGTEAIYLKYLWDGSPAAPASEIRIDWQPSEPLLVDFTRLHVVALNDGRLNFYYRVFNSNLDFEGTAVVGYNAVAGYGLTGSPPSPFAFAGANLITSPRLVLQGVVPTVSYNGGRRHPVTNQILLAMEPAGSTPGKQVHWYFGAGAGLRLDSSPLVWDADTHPNLFGGRLAQAQPDSTVNVVNVGWAGNRAGTPFKVMAGNVLGETVTSFKEFVNTYDTAIDNGATAVRPCIGEIGVEDIRGEPNLGGRHKLVDILSAPISNDPTDIGGYNPTFDFLNARLVSRLDEVEGSDVFSELGPNGTLNDVVPGLGVVQSGQTFAQDTSVITYGPDPVLDVTEFVFSAWMSFNANQPAVTRSIATKDGGAGPSFQLQWDNAAAVLRLTFTTVLDGVLSFASSVTLERGVPYYVTATYDGTQAAIYVNGWLVGALVAPVGGALDVQPTPLLLGDSTGTTNPLLSWYGFIDDVVWGSGVGVDHYTVLKNYQLGLYIRTDSGKPGGPVRTSRGAGASDSDGVVATATATRLGDPAVRVYTAALRYQNVSVDPNYEQGGVLDIWQAREDGVADPRGPIPLPAPVFDYTPGPPAPGATGVELKDRRVSFDMTMLDAGNSTDLVLVIGFRVPGDVFQVWALRFDPDSVDAVTQADWRIVTVMDLAASDEYPTALGATLYANDAYPMVMLYVDEPVAAADRRLYFIREADYSSGDPGSSTAPYVPIADLIINAAVTGSFGFENFAPPGRDPVITGIVAREIIVGQGWHPQWANSYLIIFSFGSLPLAPASFDAVENTVATVAYEVSRSSLDAGDQPIVPLTGAIRSVNSKQIDQFILGALEPFLPVSIYSLGGATADFLVLGRRGPRPWYGEQDTGKEAALQGSNGYEVYRFKREGSWSCKPVLSVPMTYQGREATRTGVSFTSPRTAPNLDRAEVVIARPFPSGQDQVSPIYLSSEEVSLGSWNLPTPTTINPLLRRNDDMTSVVWTRHELSTKALPGESTSVPPNKGAREQATVILRYDIDNFDGPGGPGGPEEPGGPGEGPGDELP